MSIQNLRANLAHAKKIQQPMWASCASRGEVEAALIEHDALIADLAALQQSHADLYKFAYEQAPRIAAEKCNKQTAALKEEIERLRRELGYIANAKHGSIECEFRAWAQNRARHALNQQPGTLTIKTT